MKHCPKCNEDKPLDQFYRDKRTASSYMSYCKACRIAYSRDRKRQGDPEKKRAYAKRWRSQLTPEHKHRRDRNQRLRTYNMTVEDYDVMLVSQGGICAICGSADPDPARRDQDRPCSFFVDHDHETGKIRGLLCRHCNTAIGHARDDPNRLLAMAAYLLASEDVVGMQAYDPQ